MLPLLQRTVDTLLHEFDQIPPPRKAVLEELANVIRHKKKNRQDTFLNFICTHNSRRSHMGQYWAQAAAHHFEVSRVECFSGGTEATAFNPKAVKALAHLGFSILRITEGTNPVYSVLYDNEASPLLAFSKKYDDPLNPFKDFVAIMTCSHADVNCPVVNGASVRFSIAYDDPKDFDETPEETERYLQRSRQIGREMLYAFSKVSG